MFGRHEIQNEAKPLAERLVGTKFALFDRQTGLTTTVTKAVEISEKLEKPNPYSGPTVLCYGEDSFARFVQYRDTFPDGGQGLTFHYYLDDVRSKPDALAHLSLFIADTHKEDFADFIIENAPDAVGHAVGTEPVEDEARLFG